MSPSASAALPTAPSPAHGGSHLFAKLLMGLVILGLAWFFVVRDTRLDPVRQVAAAVVHLTSADAAVSLPALGSHITDPEDLKAFKSAVAKIDKDNQVGAARELTMLVDKYPEIRYPVGRFYVEQGAALLTAGRYRPANECLRVACDYFVPQSGRAHLLVAETYDRLSQPDEAKRHRDLAAQYETARPNNPFDPVWLGLSLALTLFASLVLGALFNALFGAPRPSSARDEAEPGEMPAFWNAPDTLAATAEPEGPEQKYGSITKVLSAEERLEQVNVLFAEGLYQDAYEMFRKATTLNPAVSKKIAKMCLEEGVRLYEKDDVTKAAELFEVTLQHDEHSLHAHTYLANCCIKLDRFDKAVEHYLNVVQINPDNATGYYNLGICYHKIGDTGSALRAFNVAAEKENLPNAHFYLAKIHEQTGNKAEAIKHWKRCLELAPESPQGKRAQERLQAITGKG